jgi:BMFP domain-containing protein YqiC
MAMADPDPDTDAETETLALDAAGDVRLPIVEVLTGRGFICGKSGSGKSNSASVVVEELLDRGFPVLIVDTDGEYWGLKEEYEILHVGADEECDLQVGPEHAEKLARLALEDNVPIILDVSGYLDDDKADALVRETARELFATEKKLNKPFLLLVEEVHEYIPEGGGLDDTGEMLVRIGKRGRKRGLGLVGMSQRPADVKKDFITQCDWLMWHRLTWDNDTQVVRRVVDAETADDVQDLADGEGFLMTDFLETDLQRVQVRRKHTFDAGATPDLGEFERPDLKEVSGDLVDELEEISEQEERRQDRIEQLEDRVDDLQAEKEDLQAELEKERQNSETVNRLAEQLAQISAGEDGGEALAEIREEKNERIRELEADLSDARERRDELQARVEELEAELKQRPEIGERAVEAVEVLAEEFGVGSADDEALQRKLKKARERNEELEARVDDLETQLESASASVSVPTDYREFVEDDVVQDVIEEAKAETSASPRYVKGVVAAVLEEGGPVDYAAVAERLGVSTTSDVSKAASTLETLGVLERVQQSPAKVDFDLAGVEEIKAKQARREQTESVMEDL